MSDTAIQQDVEEVEVVVGNTERNNALNSIAERVKQERDKELSDNGIDPIDTSGNNLKEEPEPEVVESLPETEKEPDLVESVIETVKIKVDGQEKEVPKDKIYEAGIRTMQKESAADKRLEEATRLLREAKEYVKPKQEELLPQEWDDATVAYALEHGTEEQKAYAVGQIRGRDTTTPNETADLITKRVLDNVDFQKASEWFVSEYSDIAKDPYLFQLAGIAENKARESGDTRTYKELYKDIGNNLRTWRGGSVTQSLDSKKEQKSNIINLPSASAKKSAPVEAKTLSTSDIIENMRRSRGQR